MTRYGRIRSAAPLLALQLLAMGACDDSATEPPPNPAFRIEVSGEEFVVEVVTAAQVEELQSRLQSGAEGVITGELVAGDGGFNGPWSWHLDPETVDAVDVAIEVCDGRPSMVEEDLQYWLGTVERFCPWGARVVQRIR